MTFLHPIWLVLAIPLGLSLWAWRMPSAWLAALRAAAFLLLVLALAGLALLLPRRAGTVVVLADRSESVPDGAKAGHNVIDLVQKSMRPGERLGVVAFGQNVVVEQKPGPGAFSGFAARVDADGSDLSAAVEKALAVIPRGEPARLLVLSDGRWTGRPPDAVASQAAARGIAVDYRPVERSPANDVAVARVDTPMTVGAGESFLVNAWLHSPSKQQVAFELWRGDEVITRGTRELGSGLSRLTFRDRAPESGTLPYVLKVAGEDAGGDPVPENNRAKFLVGVEAPRSTLLVTQSPSGGLADVLRRADVKVKVLAPEQCRWTLEALSDYTSVILENVPAQTIGNTGMETLAAWVQESGSGLMMTGGRNSYGPGGYYKSPLEPVLPVSMELKQEHRKLSLAIVVALDRSGSMAMPVDGRRVKMDLANLGAAQVLDLLNATDEFGVLAVDSMPHVIQPLAPVTDKGPVRDNILRIQSMGGGIFIDVTLDQAARMLAGAKAGTKHLILFSDAADSEQPGAYQSIIAGMRKQGITVSVIGLGRNTDKDGALLEEIARLGGGRCFFTNSPEELPRLFAQDTFVVARNSFVTDPTPVRVTGGMAALAGAQELGQPPPVGGFNLCYLRPEATLAVVTADEYKAPLVSAWQAGAGRVVCYTGEVDGKYTGPIGRWGRYGDLLTSLARWAGGEKGKLPPEMMVTQEVREGVAFVKLHLDPERKKDLPVGLPEVTTLRAVPGGRPEVEKARMHWLDADTLAVEVPLRTTETTLSTVHLPDYDPVTLSPVCLPYSPEHRPAAGGTGLAALQKLARATGGRERLDVGEIWADVPTAPRLVETAPWLLLAAVVLLLVEVLERRTGMVSAALAGVPSALGGLRRIRLPRMTRTGQPAPARPAPAAAARSAEPLPPEPGPKKAPPAKPAQPAARQAEPEGLLGALRKVQDKTRRQ